MHTWPCTLVHCARQCLHTCALVHRVNRAHLCTGPLASVHVHSWCTLLGVHLCTSACLHCAQLCFGAFAHLALVHTWDWYIAMHRSRALCTLGSVHIGALCLAHLAPVHTWQCAHRCFGVLCTFACLHLHTWCPCIDMHQCRSHW